MDTFAVPIDRATPRSRPACRIAGYQSWRDLLFIHWRLPADAVAPLLPRELSLDTWQGDAWIGLVPFRMSGVRPWWSPWGVRFLETNVRTYVHFRGRDPGVWFFSLEANHRLAVLGARALWHLNYHWAEMHFGRENGLLQYESRRKKSPGDFTRIAASLTAAGAQAAYHAQPETLEHFLVERYMLYTRSASGRLWRGQVRHAAYSIEPAELLEVEQSLLAANGIYAGAPPCHALYSTGVDVEICPLEIAK